MQGVVQYQVCSDRICLLPTRVNFNIPYQIETLPVRPAYAFMTRTIDTVPAEGFSLPEADTLEKALSQGFWAFILLAAIMGALAWLTPCVFPMIPITVSYFAKQAKDSMEQAANAGMVLEYWQEQEIHLLDVLTAREMELMKGLYNEYLEKQAKAEAGESE